MVCKKNKYSQKILFWCDKKKHFGSKKTVDLLADCRNRNFFSASQGKTVRLWDQAEILINVVGRYDKDTPVALVMLPDGRLCRWFQRRRGVAV